jgi:hypothetical protein
MQSWSVAALLLVAVSAQEKHDSAPRFDPIEPDGIVVTGRRGQDRYVPDAVEMLQIFCFDPARKTRSFAQPDLSSFWNVLEPEEREQFEISDAATRAYSFVDYAREQELWLKLEKIKRSDDLDERRCTILVRGGENHDRFVRDMSRLQGRPTQRHIGLREGAPALPNWEQWLWTGMPQRGSTAWRALKTRGRSASGQSFIVVTDLNLFYGRHDYIFGDLKVRDDGPALSMISFGFVRRA